MWMLRTEREGKGEYELGASTPQNGFGLLQSNFRCYRSRTKRPTPKHSEGEEKDELSFGPLKCFKKSGLKCILNPSTCSVFPCTKKIKVRGRRMVNIFRRENRNGDRSLNKVSRDVGGCSRGGNGEGRVEFLRGV